MVFDLLATKMLYKFRGTFICTILPFILIYLFIGILTILHAINKEALLHNNTIMQYYFENMNHYFNSISNQVLTKSKGPSTVIQNQDNKKILKSARKKKRKLHSRNRQNFSRISMLLKSKLTAEQFLKVYKITCRERDATNLCPCIPKDLGE